MWIVRLTEGVFRWYGIFVCPWYSYSQIMISEVTPRGHEFLFFALFSIMGKTSAFIGPIVSSAIIDADNSEGKPGNASLPFYFLFGLSLGSMLILNLMVDLKKSRKEQEIFLEDERKERERRKSMYYGEGVGDSTSGDVIKESGKVKPEFDTNRGREMYRGA
jgi:MFS family permease